MMKTVLTVLATSTVALFTPTAWAQTNFAVLAGDGAWTWFNDPRALFHNGRLYFGYNRAADSKTVLSVFDLHGGGATPLWTSGYSQRDDHDVPGLLSKADGTMLAIYSRHLSDQYFFPTARIPSRPPTGIRNSTFPPAAPV